MDYRKFNLQIIIRVSLMAILSFITSYGIIVKGWFFTPFVSGGLLLLACLELIRHLGYYHRSLNNFLIAIRQSGFNASFPKSSAKDEELLHTFNEIIQAFHILSLEKETQLQFMNTLTENIQAGLIVFNKDGEINWMNPEARNLVRKPGINSLQELERIHPQLAKELTSLKPGHKKIITLPGNRDEIEISIQVSKISIEGEISTIGLLQNIRREMEIKEVEAWQKLTRVMRHEIMNSMTPIVSLTEAVNKVVTSKDELKSSDSDFMDIKDSLDTIEKRSKGLVKFVNAYKDFSHLPELTISKFILIEMLEKVRALFDKDMSNKGIVFKLDIKPPDLKINADRELMEQVMINLVKNSIEAFSKKGGEIHIFCRQDNDQSLLRISDNGPGIDKQIIDRVFVPFYTTKPDGSGIGLSLSRQIIHQHGGRINVVSSSDPGTTFNIEL